MAKRKQQRNLELQPAPGALAKCERCGRQLRVAESRREDSKPFRRSLVAKGFCPECVMTQFLYNTYPVNMIIDERGPEMLLNAGFMRQALLSSGVMDPKHCEMDVAEVDWERVVENWNLPVKVEKSTLNPYRMGTAEQDGRRGTPYRERFERRPLFEPFGDLVVTHDRKTGELLANGKPLSESDRELADAVEGLLRVTQADEMDLRAKKGKVQ